MSSLIWSTNKLVHEDDELFEHADKRLGESSITHDTKPNCIGVNKYGEAMATVNGTYTTLSKCPYMETGIQAITDYPISYFTGTPRFYLGAVRGGSADYSDFYSLTSYNRITVLVPGLYAVSAYARYPAALSGGSEYYAMSDDGSVYEPVHSCAAEIGSSRFHTFFTVNVTSPNTLLEFFLPPAQEWSRVFIIRLGGID